MTEKEKMLKGILYDANHNKDLLLERQKAKIKLYKYNNLSPDKEDEKKEILKSLLGKVGSKFIFESPFNCDYGYNIEIGENFYSNVNLTILDCAKVKIGNNVFISPNVGIYTAGHPFNVEERNKGLEYAYPIIIGDNVWIGANVTILPGINIGSNSIIGAGSVVTKDIPEKVLAMGNPCRVNRTIEK